MQTSLFKQPPPSLPAPPGSVCTTDSGVCVLGSHPLVTVTSVVSRTPAPPRQRLSHQQEAGVSRCTLCRQHSMRLRWGLSRATWLSLGFPIWVGVVQPPGPALPLISHETMNESSLRASGSPICTVGLATAPKPHHSRWILTDFANPPSMFPFLPTSLRAPFLETISGLLRARCGRDGVWGQGHRAERGKGNVVILEACHGPEAPTLPSTTPQGDPPRAYEAQVASREQQGSWMCALAQGQSHKSQPGVRVGFQGVPGGWGRRRAGEGWPVRAGGECCGAGAPGHYLKVSRIKGSSTTRRLGAGAEGSSLLWRAFCSPMPTPSVWS